MLLNRMMLFGFPSSTYIRFAVMNQYATYVVTFPKQFVSGCLQGFLALIVVLGTRAILVSIFVCWPGPFVIRICCAVHRAAVRPGPWWHLMCLR